MLNRRKFLAVTAAAGAAVPLSACSDGNFEAYREANRRLRMVLTTNPAISEIVRYATLAANGHNTQPWRFQIRERGISILPDFTRRTTVVDPDDHHLFVSLGCAAENLLIASGAHGRQGDLMFDSDAQRCIDIDFRHGVAASNELYQAIPKRQSTRSDFDGNTISNDDIERLNSAALMDGVSVQFITDKTKMELLLDYVIAGNSAQVDDPEFFEELKQSIRFNSTEALRTGDGLFTACSGNPTVPSWIGRLMFGIFYSKEAENDKYAAQVRTSAGVAVFTGDKENRDHWVRVGRSFQRFALQATALGIRHSHINQPLEVPMVRAEFSRWLGAAGMRPDLVIRFGYAPPLPMSMRRPVEAVLVPSI